jgi:hypothetical protein
MTTTIFFFLACKENLLLLLLLLLLFLLFSFSPPPPLPLLVIASLQVFLLPSARSTSKAPHRMRERNRSYPVLSFQSFSLVVRSRSAFEAAREHRLGNKWGPTFAFLPN